MTGWAELKGRRSSDGRLRYLSRLIESAQRPRFWPGRKPCTLPTRQFPQPVSPSAQEAKGRAGSGDEGLHEPGILAARGRLHAACRIDRPHARGTDRLGNSVGP